MGTLDIPSLLEAVEAEQERTSTGRLHRSRPSSAAIIDGSELISTDDEHDPKGATIAYERAPAAHCCNKRVRTATHSSLHADSSNRVGGGLCGVRS